MYRATLVVVGSLIAGDCCLAQPDTKPVYERALSAEDTAKVKELVKRRISCVEADDYPGAIKAMEEALTLLTKSRGKDHPNAIEAGWMLIMLRKVGALNDEDRAAWRKANAENAQFQKLITRGQLKEALALAQDYLDRHRRVLGDEHPATAQAYFNVGLALGTAGKLAEAEAQYRKSLAISDKTLRESHSDAAVYHSQLGFVLARQGKLSEAEPFLFKGLEIARKTVGDMHTVTARCYRDLASYHFNVDKLADAEVLYGKAIEIRLHLAAEGGASPVMEFGELGAVRNRMGKYEAALDALTKSIELSEKPGILGPVNVAMNHHECGIALNNLSRSADAEPHLRKALAIRNQIVGKEHPLALSTYVPLAFCLRMQEKPAEAEEVLREAIKLGTKGAGALPVVGHCHVALGWVYFDQQRVNETEPVFRKALEIFRQNFGDEHIVTAEGYHQLAVSLGALGRYAEAEQLGRTSLAIRLRTHGENHVQTAMSHNLVGYNVFALGKFAESLEHHQISAAAIEGLRLRGSARGLDRAQFEVHSDAYRALAACWLRTGRPIEAWQAIENRLVRGLLDEENARRKEPLAAADEATLKQINARLDAVSKEINRLLAERRPLVAKQKELQELVVRRKEAEQELNRLAVDLSQRPILSMDAIQAKLPADAAIILWLDGIDENCGVQEHWGAVLRRGLPVAWEELPGSGKWTRDDEALPKRLVEAMARGVASPTKDADDPLVLAKQVYAQRLAPLQKHLEGVRQLYVIATHHMSGVPIEAVLPANHRFTVSYAASGTHLIRLLEKKASAASSTLLALGDPEFARKTELPATAREIQAIAGLFDKPEVLLRSDASKDRLASLHSGGKLAQYRFVHLATHGEASKAQAFNSALILAQDIPLKASEVRDQWQLDADLVTLSACESAVGRVGGAEGQLGFSQALLIAGSRSVVLSLWPVDDTATALLMTRFYQNLLGKRTGLSKPLAKAEALREAKTWLRGLTTNDIDTEIARLPRVRGAERTKAVAAVSTPRPFEHPYYWSAFVLVGDPR